MSKVSRESIVAADLSIVSCELSGGAALLNLSSGVYYGLNEIGARVWAMVATPQSVGDICLAIEGQYDVAPERCYLDLVTILRQMADAGLVKISDA